ncbi:MAG TPA: helix-turn-helix transcriptional regulator [Acidimicrobiales bacterium]|jgi:transcriptional regulator with XRE-family HTH domain|nr:helix-turn-helix transcriptional regulator [Acidimicrobiales bacterium]
MPPMKETSPLRRKLGIELRRLREAVKMTADEAAEQLELSASTISRSETGKVNVHPRDVDAMLRIYGLTDERKREALLALARKSRERGWWHAYRNVLAPDVVSHISIEDGANQIRSFQTMLVPGLLQTEDYSRAVAAIFPRPEPPDVVDQQVEIRQRRQEILRRHDTVPLHVILDESVLHRPIGGVEVMREQLRHLLELAEGPEVTLQVTDYATGAYAGLGGPFTLFGFAEPMDLAIVHVENQRSFFLIEDEDDIRHYEVVFHRVQKSALPVAESSALVKRIAEGL